MGEGARWPLSAAVMARLRAHDWPGNVREFRNVLERAVALAGDDALREDLIEVAPAVGAARAAQAEGSLADSERVLIESVLARHQGNRTHAAEELEVAITTLRRKMRKYGLE